MIRLLNYVYDSLPWISYVCLSAWIFISPSVSRCENAFTLFGSGRQSNSSAAAARRRSCLRCMYGLDLGAGITVEGRGGVDPAADDDGDKMTRSRSSPAEAEDRATAVRRQHVVVVVSDACPD